MINKLDSEDLKIQADRNKQRSKILGPRVGDYIEMLDGSLRRFTHDWGDSLQTTVGTNHPCSGDESFYLCDNGALSFSGSLAPPIDISNIADTGKTRSGGCWFFHRDYATAHNGVRAEVDCRIYKQTA